MVVKEEEAEEEVVEEEEEEVAEEEEEEDGADGEGREEEMAGTRRLFEAIIDLLVQIPQSIFRGDWCSGPSLTFQLTSITSASLEPSVRKHQLNRRFHHGIGLDEKPQNYEPIIWGKCGEGGGREEEILFPVIG